MGDRRAHGVGGGRLIVAVLGMGLAVAPPVVGLARAGHRRPDARVVSVNMGMNDLAKHLGAEIRVFSRHPGKSETSRYYAHGKDGIGVAISVAVTVPVSDGGSGVNYGMGVAYGYRHHAIAWNEVVRIDALEATFVVHRPNNDLEMSKDPGTGIWTIDGSYARRRGRPFFQDIAASTNGHYGHRLTIGEVREFVRQAEEILGEQKASTQRPEFFRRPY